MQGNHAHLPLRSPGLKRAKARIDSTAFTLIEVVFSLGICSFALVGMLGLMILGLVTQRQSMDYSTEAVIAQKLNAEAQTLDFSSVTNTSSTYRANFQKNRYFDESGSELNNTTVPNGYVYKATLAVKSCQVPGAATSTQVAEQLIFQLTSVRRPTSTNSYNLWTVDNGR
jgi:uncharacterized protein (TIGR02598 family)